MRVDLRTVNFGFPESVHPRSFSIATPHAPPTWTSCVRYSRLETHSTSSPSCTPLVPCAMSAVGCSYRLSGAIVSDTVCARAL